MRDATDLVVGLQQMFRVCEMLEEEGYEKTSEALSEFISDEVVEVNAVVRERLAKLGSLQTIAAHGEMTRLAALLGDVAGDFGRMLDKGVSSDWGSLLKVVKPNAVVKNIAANPVLSSYLLKETLGLDNKFIAGVAKKIIDSPEGQQLIRSGKIYELADKIVTEPTLLANINPRGKTSIDEIRGSIRLSLLHDFRDSKGMSATSKLGTAALFGGAGIAGGVAGSQMPPSPPQQGVAAGPNMQEPVIQPGMFNRPSLTGATGQPEDATYNPASRDQINVNRMSQEDRVSMLRQLLQTPGAGPNAGNPQS